MPPKETIEQEELEPILEASLKVNKEGHENTGQLLENIIQQNDANNPEPLLEAGIEQSKKNTDKIVGAVENLNKKLEPQELGDGKTFIVKGTKGDKGDKGEKGDGGDKGDKGDSIKGDIGIQGEKGDKGETGIQGKKGDAGSDGVDGKDGKNGEKGDKGESGKDGKSISEELVKKYEKKVKDTQENLLWVNNGAVKSVIAGSNITVTGDPQNPIISSTGGGGGHTIEDEGTPFTQRTKLNFVGAGVTVTDDVGDDATVVTIPSGGSGITRTIVTTSGSITLGSAALTDYVYLVAGLHTMSMPAAAGNTNRYTVKNNHSVAITVDTAGAENIEGAASISVQPEDSVDIISDLTNWYII